MSSRLTPGDSSAPGTVLIIDDDISVREALDSLFRSVGLKTRAFVSTDEFLQSELPTTPCCLVLDVRLPGISGLDFQTHLGETNVSLPIVFMTGHGDIPMSVRAIKAGALDFLTKPFRDQDMLDAVAGAIALDRRRRETEEEIAAPREVFETLTPRERDVMILLAKGLLNKQVAAQLGLSEITVKIHRGRLMKKIGAYTLADIIKMADLLQLRDAPLSGVESGG
jgi:FixJ family two-component response regulator